MAPHPSPGGDPDPLVLVVGPRGTTYPCPDLPTLDGHLAALCAQLRQASPQFPSLADAFRQDIDCLLDRRRWLELASGLAVSDDADVSVR